MADLTEMQKMIKHFLDGGDKNFKKKDNKKRYTFNKEKKWECKNIPKLNIHKIQVKNQISKRSTFNNNAQTKILNADANFDDYMKVFDSFEGVLNDMQVDEESRPNILIKLKSIERLIQIKIQHLTPQDKLNMDIFSKFFTPPLSENLRSTSMQSLCSVGSQYSMIINDKKSYEEFMLRISCPFCSKLQIDRIHFIKHLDQDCESFRNKSFSIKCGSIPYSQFQILPNNTFKCNVCPHSVSRNIELYFFHKSSFQHENSSNNLSKDKKYTEDLFCSSCKMLIPNTYVQLKCHINHPEHKRNCDDSDIVNLVSSKFVSLVYIHFRRFKCLVCHQIAKPTLKDLLTHCQTSNHERNLKKLFLKSDVIYCKCCDKEYKQPSQFEYHFSSEEHKRNDKRKIREDETFELCFFCGLKTPNLMKLSTHMTSQCDEIGSMRIFINGKLDEKNLKANAIENKEESTVDVTELKSNDKTDEHCIWIKGCTETQKLLEVFKFFRAFGEVDSFKFCHGTTLMIRFKERTVVDEVLAKREAIRLKLDVEIIGSPDRNESTSESEMEDREVDTTDSDSASSSEDDNLADWSWGKQDLQSLFQRVSSHLFKLTQKSDSTTDQLIARDCALTLDCKKCTLLGFRAKGLSFPTDSFSFFCDFESFDFKNQEQLVHSEKFIDVLSKCHSAISKSKLWKDVEIIKIPWLYIKCKHVETKETCTVSFHRAFAELTDMLGNISEQNTSFQSFFLIIRMWFAIQKFSLGDLDYPLISLLIFFLINSRMASLDVAPNSIHNKISFLAMNETYKVSTETRPVPHISELFQNFLTFLQNFDFAKNAICLPLNHPVQKQLLTSPWFKCASGISKVEFSSSYLWIMDSKCSMNFGSSVDENEFRSILKTAKETLKHYKL